jgi:hypothetical protein
VNKLNSTDQGLSGDFRPIICETMSRAEEVVGNSVFRVTKELKSVASLTIESLISG